MQNFTIARFHNNGSFTARSNSLVLHNYLWEQWYKQWVVVVTLWLIIVPYCENCSSIYEVEAGGKLREKKSMKN